MTGPAPPGEAVAAVRAAIGLLTYELGTLPDDYPLRTVRPRAVDLQSAIDSLLEAIAGAPDATLADAEFGESQRTDELDQLLDRSAIVSLSVDLPADAPSLVQHLARHLAGAALLARRLGEAPGGDLYEIDLGAVLLAAVDAAEVDPQPRVADHPNG